MTYNASLDGLAKGVTMGVTMLFAGILFISVAASKDLLLVMAIIFSLIHFICFAFSPVKYTITPEVIVVHRVIGDVFLRRERLASAVPVIKGDMKWTIRTFGVGGLFGYFGHFANKRFGSMVWYATRRDRMILLTTTCGRKIIITPDDRAGFLAELNPEQDPALLQNPG